MSASFSDRLKVWPQYLLPKQLLTALAWRLSTCRAGWFRRLFISVFVRLFGVDLSEAERTEPSEYDCFNDFFTRSLKPGARALADKHHLMVSPSDGTISQLGRLREDTIIQAKGLDYSAAELLGSEQRAAPFANGHFITVYLAPRDYHRVHSPIAGHVTEEIRIPGELFSVSATTVRAVPRLFSRNERMIAMLDTAHGPVAVVMVAAMLVAGIETVWGGPADRRPDRAIRVTPVDRHFLDRGAELGRFHWGSTVIVLTPEDFPRWQDDLAPGRRVKMGEGVVC